LSALAQAGGNFSLGFGSARGSGLEFDVAAHDSKPHRGETIQARSIELAHLDGLV
jgi:hypothetical protein